MTRILGLARSDTAEFAVLRRIPGVVHQAHEQRHRDRHWIAGRIGTSK